MTQAELLADLTVIFRACFDDESIELRPSTTARDIAAWDSAKMVTLILAVEERFAIRMHSREIDALRCVGDWIRILETKIGPR